MKKKIILYIAMSLDGFIAGKNGSVDFLDQYNESGEDYGYKKFYDSVNTVLMGSSTYKQVLGFGEFPYKGKNCFVFSKKIKEGKYVKFVNGDIKKFMKKHKPQGNIWLVGGADLASQFLEYDSIDKFIIFIVPILLGKGIPLFKRTHSGIQLKLLNTKTYKSGMVQLNYERVRNKYNGG